MQCYRDTKGRTWDLSIDVAQIKRVKAMAGVELHGLLAGNAEELSRLLGNPVLLCDVLFALCSRQAEERKLSDMDFAAGLGGDALEAAAEAFVQELIDFFPDHRRRLALKTVLAKSREMMDEDMEEALKAAQSMDLRQLRSGPPSGGSPGPAGSTLTP